jgi:hypothetical protein
MKEIIFSMLNAQNLNFLINKYDIINKSPFLFLKAAKKPLKIKKIYS